MSADVNAREHRDLQSLLGAFVLNATSAIEARRIERHLTDCDECAREVKMLREPVAELAWLTEPEDTGDLVDRISDALPPRPRRIATRISVAIAAVAVAVAGLLGATVVNQRATNRELADVLAESSRRVALSPQGGFEGRGVLHIAGDKAALVLDDLPSAGSGRTYQLWAIAGAKPRSMTVVGGTGRVVRLMDWTGSGDRFAVTIEPAGGSPVPTTDPVLMGA